MLQKKMKNNNLQGKQIISMMFQDIYITWTPKSSRNILRKEKKRKSESTEIIDQEKSELDDGKERFLEPCLHYR